MKRRDFLIGSAYAMTSTISQAKISSATLPWSTTTPLPIRTQELYPAIHQGRLYVAGGIASRLGATYFTDRFFSFDPSKNLWHEETNLPESLHHAALVSCQNRLFLVGGFNGGYTHVWRMRDKVYEYIEGIWHERAALPAPQAEGVLTCHNGLIHLVSGQSPRDEKNKLRHHHKEVNHHLVWEPGSSQWESAAPIPLASNSATGAWVGNQLVYTGGRNSNGNFDATYIYDKQEDRWRKASPLPLPQAGTASVAVEDGIIVFGGEIFVPNSKVFKNVWRYVLSKDQWLPLADMPTPRHGIGAGRIGDKIYVVGGATEPGGNGTSNLNEVFSL